MASSAIVGQTGRHFEADRLRLEVDGQLDFRGYLHRVSHALPVRGSSQDIIFLYGSRTDGIRSMTLLAKALACSSACRLSFESDIHFADDFSPLLVFRIHFTSFLA